jgi:translation initiation factor 1 (eIF-1/SUI1)
MGDTLVAPAAWEPPHQNKFWPRREETAFQAHQELTESVSWELTKKMRGACGGGGTVKDGAIEIQGDQREKMAKILLEAGFRPVLAGG